MLSTVLVVDDDPVHRALLDRIITRLGYGVRVAESGEEALAILSGREAQSIDIVLLDLVMPDLDGMAVLNRLQATGSRIPVVALVSPGGVDGVLGAISAGASDFAVKPVGIERLQVTMMNALRLKALMAGVESDHRLASDDLTISSLAESDPGMARVANLAGKALKGDLPLLIEGESGTGKAILARAMHGSSLRSKKPFVTLDCSMLRPSETVARLMAAMERVKGGTLYLSSINCLDGAAQMALAQTDMITAPSVKTPRLVASSRKSLIDLARSGAFREDLFYRLTVTPIRIPPLRERPFDLPLLAERTALRLASEAGRDIRGLTAGAVEALLTRRWSGNYPEFEAIIRLAVGRGTSAWLTEADFAGEVEASNVIPPRLASEEAEGETLALFDGTGRLRAFADIEAELINRAQKHCGSLGKAAKALGLGRSTLYRKLQGRDVAEQSTVGVWMGDAA